MSKLTEPAKSIKQSKIHNTDIRILEGLAFHGPRNRAKLAAQLSMPDETLRYRMNHLRFHFSLNTYGSLYHTHIGLRKVVVFAESEPGYEELLYQCLKTNDYWLYISQCIGNPKCLAIYGIPAGKEEQFAEFLETLAKLAPIRSVKFYWSTCFQNINTTTTWFDSTSEEWVFPWDSWLKEVPMKKGELPYTLKDPDEYPQKADWADIMILKELERDSAVKLSQIAKKLHTSLQGVKYHYENHVIKEKMYEGHQIVADHYKGLNPETYYFRFVFKNKTNLEKFAQSLLDKPFVRVVGKVYHKNELFVQIYLPRQQLRNFLETLSKLVRTKFLKTYEYVIQDLTKTERQSISYEYFKDNNWAYDHKKYLKKIRSTAKQFAEAA
jgi:DNA-binding Lrp family transcriptional regulator